MCAPLSPGQQHPGLEGSILIHGLMLQEWARDCSGRFVINAGLALPRPLTLFSLLVFLPLPWDSVARGPLPDTGNLMVHLLASRTLRDLLAIHHPVWDILLKSHETHSTQVSCVSGRNPATASSQGAQSGSWRWQPKVSKEPRHCSIGLRNPNWWLDREAEYLPPPSPDRMAA